MCINAKVSIITFLTSLTLCLYLFKRNNVNDRVLAIWIFSFSLMQLIEYFMWNDYDNKNNINNIATKIGLLAILIQPIILAIGMLIHGDMYHSSNLKIFIKVLILVLIIKFVLASKYVYDTRNEDWSSKKGPNCHFIWHFSQNSKNMPWYTHVDLLFFGPLLFFMLMIKPYPTNIIYTLFGSSTLLYTYITNNLETGSYWCWIANLMAILVVIFNK
jgi:hypothetical protein